MIEVQLPNGDIAEFPDSMKPAEIQAILQKQFPKPQPQGKISSIPEMVGTALTDPVSESLQSFEPSGAMQELGKMGVKYAPEIGLIAGGAIPGLIPGGQAISPITAGLGYYGGQMVKRAVGEGGALTPKEEALAMPTGAAMEMGGKLIGKGLGKAFAPAKNWYARLKASSEQARMIQEMVNQGIPISPDLQAPHPFTKSYMWITDKFPFGKKITDTYRWQTLNAINQMRYDFIKKSGYPSPVADISKLKDIQKGFYGKATEEAAGKEIPIPNLKAFFESMPKEATRSAWWRNIGQKKFLRQQEIKGISTFDDLNDAFIPNKVWGFRFDPARMPANQQIWRNQMVEAMRKDLSEFDKLMNTAVLKNYEGGHKFGEVIRGSDKSNKLEGWLNDSMDVFELREFFNPGKFKTLLDKNKPILFKEFSHAERQNIYNFADRMALVGQDINRLMKPQGSALKDIAAMGTALYFQPWVAVPMGFPAIAAYSLMKPSGLVRRWLTTGLEPKFLLKSAEMGTKIKLVEAAGDYD